MYAVPTYFQVRTRTYVFGVPKKKVGTMGVRTYDTLM